MDQFDSAAFGWPALISHADDEYDDPRSLAPLRVQSFQK